MTEKYRPEGSEDFVASKQAEQWNIPESVGKFTRKIEKVVKPRQAIFRASLALMMLTSACAPKSTSTPENESTPKPTMTQPLSESTATPFVPEVQATLEETATLIPIPTKTVEAVQAEQRKVFSSEKLEYGHLKFGFEISMLESDLITKQTLEKYGIVSMAVNKEKPNANQLLAKTIVSSFLETYNVQNKKAVSLPEYEANPGNYPLKIDLLEGGKKIQKLFTFDQIKTVDVRFTSGIKGELYMRIPSQSPYGSGYGFDNGRFILYIPMSPDDTQIKNNLEFNTSPEDVNYGVGNSAGDEKFFINLGFMPYTMSSREELKKLDNTNVFTKLYSTAESLWPGGKMSNEQGNAWIKIHNFFVATCIKINK